MRVSTVRDNGVPEADIAQRIEAFLDSEASKNYPVNQLGSLLWAVIAQRAAAGQRRPPNRGMVNDINTVSSLLPFCDAMLVDNECRALIGNIPQRHQWSYPTLVFSPDTGAEFLAYL